MYVTPVTKTGKKRKKNKQTNFPKWACQLHAHSAVPTPSPTLHRHRCALFCVGLQCHDFVQDGSNKFFFSFFRVNEGHLT